MSNLLLFDVDKTLFNSSILKAHFQTAFSDYLAIPLSELQTTYLQYADQLETSTDFNPVTLTEFLGQVYQADEETLLKIFYTPEWFAASVFPDVEPVMSSLFGITDLGVFSEADDDFQRQKLELSGLSHWFKPEHVYIFPRKLAPEALSQLPEAMVVDDKREVIEALVRHPQILPVWLNRNDTQRIQGIPTIHALTELLEMV